MLYHRDARTGEHLVVHNGRERRFPTRAEALTAARELMSEDPNPSSDEAR